MNTDTGTGDMIITVSCRGEAEIGYTALRLTERSPSDGERQVEVGPSVMSSHYKACIACNVLHNIE